MATWGSPKLQADYAEVCNGFSSAHMLHFSSGYNRSYESCHYTGEQNIQAKKH